MEQGGGIIVGTFLGIGITLGIMLVSLWNSDKIKLSEYNWKCTQALIVDNDPSKTECVVYRRKDKIDEH